MILDSDVLIDIKRGSEAAAQKWFANLREYPLVSRFSAIELLFGSRDARELREVEVFLDPFVLIWPSKSDVVRAMSYAKLKLHGGLGAFDALTASLAVGRNESLATFNTKHFRHVPDIRLIQPYNRTQPPNS